MCPTSQTLRSAFSHNYTMSERIYFLEAEIFTRGIMVNSNNVRVQATFYMMYQIGRFQHFMYWYICHQHYFTCLSPPLLYLGLPWLTGALVFSIQGVTTVILVLIHALGPIHGEERCPTRDSICQGHREQTRLGSKVQTLVYSDEDRHSHKSESGSATSSSNTVDT